MSVSLPLRTAADLSDMTGRTVVVTRASRGLGAEAVRALARAGARVVMAVRDPAKGRRVADAIGVDVPGGSYVGPDGSMGVRRSPRLVEPAPAAKDPDVARGLWSLSAELTAV